MKKAITITILVIAIISVIFLILYFNHQNKLSAKTSECTEECSYISPREWKDTGDSRNIASNLIKDKGDYWVYNQKKLETQQQCIDYCLIVKGLK